MGVLGSIPNISIASITLILVAHFPSPGVIMPRKYFDTVVGSGYLTHCVTFLGLNNEPIACLPVEMSETQAIGLCKDINSIKPSALQTPGGVYARSMRHNGFDGGLDPKEFSVAIATELPRSKQRWS